MTATNSRWSRKPSCPTCAFPWDEARDIASYLMTLKKQEPSSYARADYLNDPNLKAQGHALVQRYGCAGCHEIAGMEDEGRIGTELTKEGSKPIEQIDFALLTAEAREQGWYDHKGFFEHKLEKPEIYDTGRDWKDRDPNERLRMPDFDMKPQEISALTTFLMGAVDSQVPPRYWDTPEDQRRDIQEGWWVVKKYNCMGCHQFMVGQSSHLMTLARYQTPEWKDQLPPKLMGEGARANPDWMLKFLANPAMDPKDTDRNGVRPYLKVRMPTFYFSPIEIRKLVRFFQALAGQPMPYIPPKLEPLSDQEIAMARALFTSKAAPCLKCHATGDRHARQVCHRAELPAGARPAEARMGAALDARSLHDQPRHRHAFRLVQAGRRPLRFRRPHARYLQGLRRRPARTAGALPV